MGRMYTIFTLFCVPLTQVYCEHLHSAGQHDHQLSHLASSAGSLCPWHRDPLKLLTHEWAATSVSPLELVPGSCAGNLSDEVCAYVSPTFANNLGVAFVTSPKRAERLAQSASLTDPLLHSQIERLNEASDPRWEVREIPGKGMGVIATSPLSLGDHIMSSTPAIAVDFDIFDLPDDQATELRVRAIEHLPPVLRSSFLNLTTHDDVASFAERVDKIVEVNSFEYYAMGGVEDDKSDEDWLVVFPEVSRLNHACRPNAQYYFDPVTMVQHIHAVTDIYPGEEITISYIEGIQSYKERQKVIHNMWHFGCSCEWCSRNSHQIAASDDRVRQISKLTQELQDRSRHSKATPEAGELLVSLYRQEKMWYEMYKAYAWAALEYNFVGEARLATMYANLAIEHGIVSAGPEYKTVVGMRKLAKDPRNHWSWMYRVNQREAYETS